MFFKVFLFKCLFYNKTRLYFILMLLSFWVSTLCHYTMLFRQGGSSLNKEVRDYEILTLMKMFFKSY